MIKLTQSTINTVALSLNENVTIVDPVYFLFEFINDDTNDRVYCTALETSPNTVRYNKFNIELTTGADDPLNGVITLKPDGSWKYNVYQQASSTNIDPDLTGDMVETGKVMVIGTADPTIVQYSTTDNDENIVYYKN